MENESMSSDVTKVAEKYLEKNGYPFEMKVASQLQRAGFGLHQSIYYNDVNTGLPREIDIVAIWIAVVGGKNFNIVVPIECKYAPTPWILFAAITEGFPYCYLSNGRAHAWMNHLIHQPHFSRFFEIERNVGYGLTAVNSKADSTKDNAYEASQTLLNFLKSERKDHRFSHGDDYTLYIPVAAIRGKLVEAKLNEQENIVCREINEGQVFYKENVFGVIPKIHVVTEDNLSEYIGRLAEDCRRITAPPFLEDAVINPPLQPTMSVQPQGPRHTL